MNTVQLVGTIDRIRFFGKDNQWCGMTVICPTEGSDKPPSIKMTVWSEEVAASLVGAEKGMLVKITGYIENRKEKATETVAEHWELAVHVKTAELQGKAAVRTPIKPAQPPRQEEDDDLGLPF